MKRYVALNEMSADVLMQKVHELYADYQFSMKDKKLADITNKIANKLHVNSNVVLAILSQSESVE